MSAGHAAAVVGAVLSLLLGAYLAAVETVVNRLNVVRALRLAEEDQRGAPALLWLTEHRASALNALLVVTVVARVVFVALLTLVGWWLVGGTLGVVGTALLAALLSLVLGEVTPRTLALRHLEATGLRLASSAKLLVRVVGPVATLIVSLGRPFVPRRHEVSGPYASDDELRQLDADAEDQDEELEPEERAMIRSIFELADTRVREIMTPRPDMITVAQDATIDEVVGISVERGTSRIPVHDPEDAATIVGVVHAKDLLERVATSRRSDRWVDLVREPMFVPETKRCDELLRDVQASATHLAVVVDEHGAVVGLATIEDILEEIVGDIVDEHDREEPLVDLLDDGRMRIDARLGVDDLNELLHAELPEEGWDTVGGLVFGTLGRVPTEGEVIDLDAFSITVERIQGRRIGKVLVARREDGAEETA